MAFLKRVLLLAGLALAGANPAAGSEPGLNYIVPAQSESTEGEVLPPLLFADGSGMPIKLDRFVGFVVVLTFWSEHCGPCLQQLPNFDRLQGYFRSRKFLVIPVSVDPGGSAGAKAFFAKYRYSFLRPYADPGASMARALRVTGLPTTIVIDKTGRALGRAEGVRVWDSQDMLDRFNWLLSRP